MTWETLAATRQRWTVSIKYLLYIHTKSLNQNICVQAGKTGRIVNIETMLVLQKRTSEDEQQEHFPAYLTFFV